MVSFFFIPLHIKTKRNGIVREKIKEISYPQYIKRLNAEEALLARAQ